MKQTLAEGVDAAALGRGRKERKGPAAGCHVRDGRVADLSFHTLIKSHPGVLDASQSPGALGEKKKKAKQAGSHNIIVNADPTSAPLCSVMLYIHGHARTSAPVNTATMQTLRCAL